MRESVDETISIKEDIYWDVKYSKNNIMAFVDIFMKECQQLVNKSFPVIVSSFPTILILYGIS